MIKKLYEEGCFDYKKFIFNNMKKLALSLDEASVLTFILDSYDKNKNVTTEDIISVLPITRLKADKALANLLERGFYEVYVDYESGVGTEMISLNQFFGKVEALLNNTLDDPKDELYLVNQYLTKELNRILVAKELEIVSSLVLEDRYNLDAFTKAVEYLKSKGKNLSIRTIAQALGTPQEVKATPKTSKSSVVKDFMNNIK